LMEVLNDLNFFYNDLNQLVIDYAKTREWGSTAVRSLKQNAFSAGIIGDQKHLYICNSHSRSSIAIYSPSASDEVLQENRNLTFPCGIDIDKKILYYILLVTTRCMC